MSMHDIFDVIALNDGRPVELERRDGATMYVDTATRRPVALVMPVNHAALRKLGARMVAESRGRR